MTNLCMSTIDHLVNYWLKDLVKNYKGFIKDHLQKIKEIQYSIILININVENMYMIGTIGTNYSDILASQSWPPVHSSGSI